MLIAKSGIRNLGYADRINQRSIFSGDLDHKMGIYPKCPICGYSQSDISPSTPHYHEVGVLLSPPLSHPLRITMLPTYILSWYT